MLRRTFCLFTALVDTQSLKRHGFIDKQGLLVLVCSFTFLYDLSLSFYSSLPSCPLCSSHLFLSLCSSPSFSSSPPPCFFFSLAPFFPLASPFSFVYLSPLTTQSHTAPLNSLYGVLYLCNALDDP